MSVELLDLRIHISTIKRMDSKTLHQYALNNSHKRMDKWIHYFDIYERHFARFRGKSPVMMEIGVMGGGSLAMWKDYFGSGCQIIGLDINAECKQHECDGIEIFIGSQDDHLLIDGIFSKYPRIDIVLDDGSHMMHHLSKSFEMLYENLSDNGVYVVEDTHTCYWEEYGGGLDREGSFMELVKSKLDDLNAIHTRGRLPVSKFTRTTDSITCYDSVVVFERRRQAHRQSLITHAM